ncbi:sporulation histidine kinase inhibitor Sda [Sporosarcina sp. FSL K6-3457]
MSKLPDDLLIKSYTTAKASNLNPLFIYLLEVEMNRRSLFSQIQKSS